MQVMSHFALELPWWINLIQAKSRHHFQFFEAVPIHHLLPSQYHFILNFIEVDYHRCHQIFRNHLIDYYFQPQMFNDEIQNHPPIINLPINFLLVLLSSALSRSSEHSVHLVFSISKPWYDPLRTFFLWKQSYQLAVLIYSYSI